MHVHCADLLARKWSSLTVPCLIESPVENQIAFTFLRGSHFRRSPAG